MPSIESHENGIFFSNDSLQAFLKEPQKYILMSIIHTYRVYFILIKKYIYIFVYYIDNLTCDATFIGKE